MKVYVAKTKQRNLSQPLIFIIFVLIIGSYISTDITIIEMLVYRNHNVKQGRFLFLASWQK